MMIESGADGVFFWWYPGGFRLGENSDFGIINPDGTDRPVTKVIRSEGPRFLKARKPGKPEDWIAVDRDRDARGLFGIYEAAKAEFWKAMNEGRRPGLKWAREPGSAKERVSRVGRLVGGTRLRAEPARRRKLLLKWQPIPATRQAMQNIRVLFAAFVSRLFLFPSSAPAAEPAQWVTRQDPRAAGDGRPCIREGAVLQTVPG